MSYDPDRHHRRSVRLRNYDYSSAGAYFVTILVKDRECLLGEIVAGEMHLSEIGEAVQAIWESLPERYPGTELDESVIMPNHVHGVIVVTPEAEQAADADGDVGAVLAYGVKTGVGAVVRAVVRAVHEPPLRTSARDASFSPAPPIALERRRMLLPKIIGYFKMNTAKRANQIRSMRGASFWQRDYYEHVIRDKADLQRIREYIGSNPLKWELDQVHPGNPLKW